mgnify:CR=1 FL=1
MTDDGLVCVQTTIQAPTASVRSFARVLSRIGARLIVVGDTKGPDRDGFDVGRLITIDEQRRLPFSLARSLPENHYARKNLGYLAAMAEGAYCIYETDDDNAPLDSWRARQERVSAEPVQPRPWVNAYRLFSPETHIWPRGFPLELVRDATTWDHKKSASEMRRAPIQQGLADGSPDVDAVWRLVLDRGAPVNLGADTTRAFALPSGTWCPFNSQSTWWWPDAYPLLYLPSLCSFRMTDIWRSFIAQRCLWELGLERVFVAPEVFQERNPHDLMRDFRDEIVGYECNRRLCSLLERTALESGPGSTVANLRTCYQALVASDLVPAAELRLVDAWIDDLSLLGYAKRR